MNLKFPVFAFMSASFLLGSAEFVSPEAALERARNNRVSVKMPSRDPRNFRLVRSLDLSSGDTSLPALYIFREERVSDDAPSAFLITPADDRFPDVIGYGVSPHSPGSELPSNLKAWLDDYVYQISSVVSADNAAGAGGCDPASRISIDPGEKIDYITKYRRPIDPLLTSTWDQLAPYYDLCPLSTTGMRCLTGCVATAMAQIMYYHKWPETGEGNHSYDWGGRPLSFDFEHTTFDWDNMLPAYKDVESTEEQREAVARLMLACGISVYMNYSPTASGAYSKMVSDALKDFFRYGEGTSNVTRINYSESEWENIIYRELEEGRPVLYTGAGTGGGHAFVCDGYDSDGYFHFNWGWSGAYDGYFRLASLNPRGTGAGGGSGAYNNYQDATIGIVRPGEPTVEPVSPIYCTGGFGMENTYTVKGDSYEVIFKFPENGEAGWIVNGSRHEQPGTLGVVFVRDTENVMWCEGPDCVFGSLSTDGSMTGYMRYSTMIPRSGFEPGSYMIFPAFRPEGGEWIRPRVMNGQPQFVVMTVADDGKIRFSSRTDDQTPEMEVDVLQDVFGTPEGSESDNQIYSDDNKRKFLFSSINRDIPYEGLVGIYMRKSENEESRLVSTVEYSQSPFTIEDFEVELPDNIGEGDYLMHFKNYYGYQISPEFNVSVGLPTGVDEIIDMNNGSAKTEYFTIDGLRVRNSEGFRGILIEVGPDGTRKLAF